MNRPRYEVSVVIVYYKGQRRLMNAIESLKLSKFKSFEIIVVDNSDGNDLEQKLDKKVVYIKSSGNIGYGAGNNLGAKYAKGRYLFFLNPDTLVFPETISKLVEFLDNNPEAAIVAPLLLDRNKKPYSLQGSGKLDPLTAIFAMTFINKILPNNRFVKDYYYVDWDQKTTKEFDAVPGSAFMIRKNIFNKVDRFDENMFLYFEEQDLGNRVKNENYKIFIQPEAKTVHFWGDSTSKVKKKKIDKIFRESRFYYFKKNFGVFNAIVVELFARFSKWHAILTLILTLSVFLRLYKLPILMHFIGDFGWYYLSARDFTLTGEIPLVGIPSSVPVIQQGAVYTLFLAVALWLGNFNPLSGAILSVGFGLVSITLVYKITKEWYGEKPGLICAYLAATFPFLVYIDRTPFVLAPAFTFMLLTVWLFDRAVKRKDAKYFFLLGFLFALSLQILLGLIILLPVFFLTFVLTRQKLKLVSILAFAAGVFYGLIPFLIWDLRQGVFIQTIGFFIWFFAKPFELLLKGGAGSVFQVTLFLQTIKTLVFPLSFWVSFLILTTSFLVFVKNMFAKRKEDAISVLISVWFVVAFVSYLLRGEYSEAFLPLLIFPVIIFLGLMFGKIITFSKVYGLLMLLIFSSFNILYLVGNYISLIKSPNIQSLGMIDKASEFILDDSSGEKFNFIYLGPGYQYHSGGNNFEYIFWYKGMNISKDAEITYYFYNQERELPYNFDKIESIGRIRLGVKKND